jgi:hypothetical protein
MMGNGTNLGGVSMRSILAAAVMVLTMGAAADAAIVGSGPAFGNGQTVAVCYYSNLGTTSVTFSSATIHKEFQPAIPEVLDNCTTVFQQASCRVVANLGASDAGVAHWCRAVVDNKANLRGRLEIRNGLTVLTSETIR